MWLTNVVVKSKLKGVMKNMSNDRKASLLGFVLSALTASTIDYSRLLDGDANEVGKLGAAVTVAVFGYFTNKGDKPGVEGK